MRSAVLLVHWRLLSNSMLVHLGWVAYGDLFALQAFLENAHTAAKIRDKMNSIYDQFLKDVEFSLPAYIRRGRAVAELKKLYDLQSASAFASITCTI